MISSAVLYTPQHESTTTRVSNASVYSNNELDERWLAPIRRRLTQLMCLHPSWDSFGAPQIDPQNAQAALEILQLVMDDDMELPEVFPTAGGGVQLEWGRGDFFVEVEVIDRTHLEVYSRHGPDEDPKTTSLRFDTSPLCDLVLRLSSLINLC